MQMRTKICVCSTIWFVLDLVHGYRVVRDDENQPLNKYLWVHQQQHCESPCRPSACGCSRIARWSTVVQGLKHAPLSCKTRGVQRRSTRGLCWQRANSRLESFRSREGSLDSILRASRQIHHLLSQQNIPVARFQNYFESFFNASATATQSRIARL